MNKYLSTPMAQAVLAALGRGIVMALLAYFGMLVKHVADRDTIIGVVGITLLIPMAGLLHLTVPSLPLAMQARLFPRIGERTPQPAPDSQRPPPQAWTQPPALTDTQRITADDAHRNRPAQPDAQQGGWNQPPQSRT